MDIWSLAWWHWEKALLFFYVLLVFKFCHLLSPPPPLSPPSAPPHIPYSFFSLPVAGGDEAVTPGSNDIKSTRLALSLSFSPSSHLSIPVCSLRCLVALTPTWAWQASASIPSLLVSVSVEWQWKDQGAGEWWMAVPPALSLPFPRPLSSHCLPGARLCW